MNVGPWIEIAMMRRLGELSAENYSLQQATIAVCNEMEEYYENMIGEKVVRFTLPYRGEEDVRII